MTKYLIDTQILIWWLDGSEKLSKEFLDILEGDDIKMVSVASFWEIVIKLKIKKIKLKRSLNYVIKNLEFHILNIDINHVLRTQTLQGIHKDPFDRILIAQSLVENCKLLTSDEKIKKYF